MSHAAWILRRRPDASVKDGDLELVERPLPSLDDGEIQVRNIYVSLDPTNRLWMSDREQYLPPVGIGQVMRGTSVGIVEATRSDRFACGDHVIVGDGGWQTHCVISDKAATRFEPADGIPLTAYLSVLGATGLTAYFGLLDVCRPQAGETIAVSAAAGAVGSIVGQIARLQGCRVIGIAGGPDKCRWLTDDLRFDAAIDYRAEDVGQALDRVAPDGIDMNFENVGGAIMNAVFERLRRNGRMALCGMISQYNDEGAMAGPQDFGRILMQRLTVRGFIVIDYFHRAREAHDDLVTWIRNGDLTWKDDVVNGIAAGPEALGRLFTGAHDGKLMLRVDA